MNRVVSCCLGLMVCVALFVSGCGAPASRDSSEHDAPVPASRYSQQHDAAPTLVLDPERIMDAVPQPTEIRAAGNVSPYTVNGATYRVMPVATAQQYRKQGKASWYGAKFHGHQTSNGEIYNMYEMSAAHKTLPIPCYAKVTNLDNGRTAIVRVNDRGPFHSDRIIDLSYAAATKLGYMEHGVASVRVEVIDPATWQKKALPAVASAPLAGVEEAVDDVAEAVAEAVAELPKLYLQAAALSEANSAESLRTQLSQLVDEPVSISSTQRATLTLYRVRIGPLRNAADAERISAVLTRENLGRPHVVYE